MTVERAFHLLGIGPECTVQELNGRFRSLAKKYHPDANGTDSSDSHEKMTLLNLAFEVALEHIEMRTFIEETRNSAPGSMPAEEQAAPVPNNTEQHTESKRLADRSVDEIRDAIFLYYQYGLENVHMRGEGSGRFRYRTALRKIKSGLAGLTQALSDYPVSNRKKALESFSGFSEVFLENMLISRFFIPTPQQHEVNGYRHYHTGASYLDRAVRDLFCAELNSGRSTRHFTSDTIQLVERELMTVLTRYYASSWTTESLVKLRLLERLVAGLPWFSHFL